MARCYTPPPRVVNSGHATGTCRTYTWREHGLLGQQTLDELANLLEDCNSNSSGCHYEAEVACVPGAPWPIHNVLHGRLELDHATLLVHNALRGLATKEELQAGLTSMLRCLDAFLPPEKFRDHHYLAPIGLHDWLQN